MTPAKNSLHSTTHGKWYGKGLARAAILVVAAALVAAVAARFSIAHDYGYLRATILSGSPGGYYYMLATRLADRAKRGHGLLTVASTEGFDRKHKPTEQRSSTLRGNVWPDPGRHADIG